jgi:hypothetical protein
VMGEARNSTWDPVRHGHAARRSTLEEGLVPCANSWGGTTGDGLARTSVLRGRYAERPSPFLRISPTISRMTAFSSSNRRTV